MDKNRNIFLIGFMGSGKTHWGKIWAGEMGTTFIDLDQEIEKSFGLPIQDIFEKHGEAKFRHLEKVHLRKIRPDENLLVACGGGTPCFDDNMKWMLDNGIVVYLSATPQYILKRVMDERDHRPLLKKLNPSEVLYFIEQKLGERESHYNKAHYILDVEKLRNNSLNAVLAQHGAATRKASDSPLIKLNE